MSFVRGIDPKQSLGVGMGQKIQKWMEKSATFSYEEFYHVWKWALANKKDIVFPYLASLNGKSWVNGEIIDLTDPDYLWESIYEGNVAAVKAVLTIPKIFEDEVFILEQGTSELKDQYVERGDSKIPMRATNFGTYLNLANVSMHGNKPNPEIKKLLMEYYNKHHAI